MHTSLRLQPRADPTASSSRRNAALGKVRRSIFGCERKDAARLVHTHCASPSGAAVAPAGYDVKARTRQALGIPPPLPGRSRKGSNNYPSDQLEDAARRECRRLVEAVDSPDGPASLAALLSLRDGVASATSSLRPSHLLDSGFVQVLVPLIARPDCSPASAVATALEVLCWSLGPAATRELTDAQLISLEPLVPTLLSYISAKLDAAQGTAAGESLGAAVAATGSPRAAPTFPSCSLHPAAAAPTCSIAGNWDAGTFFAVSAVVKLARLPRLPATIIEHGGLQVLVRALNAPAASMLPQVMPHARLRRRSRTTTAQGGYNRQPL